MSRVELSAVVVAWRAASDVAALVAAWPTDARAELLIVDQSRELPAAYPNARVLRPERNLGFAGGANFGAAAAAGSSLLFLNPDVRPEPGAIAALIDGFAVDNVYNCVFIHAMTTLPLSRMPLTMLSLKSF